MNEPLTEAQFQIIWLVITGIARSAQLVSIADIERLLDTIAISAVLVPVLDPTRYKSGGMESLEAQEILALGFLEFRKAIEKVRHLIEEKP